MSITDRWLQASFRGAAFLVPTSSVEGGRKTAVHEYPNRDTRYVEDMGAMPRTFSLTGLIHQDRDGAQYFARRDALLTALEEPGPGTLVHPTFGSVTVASQPYSLSEDQKLMGVATFTMLFLRTDFIANPVAPERSAADVRYAADAAIASAGQGLAESFSIAGGDASVLQDAKDLLDDIPHAMSSALGDIALDATGMASFNALTDNFSDNIGGYMADPSMLASGVTDLADGFYMSAATPEGGLRAAGLLFDAAPMGVLSGVPMAANTVSAMMRQSNRDAVGAAVQSLAYGLGVKSAVARVFGNNEELAFATGTLNSMFDTMRSDHYVPV